MKMKFLCMDRDCCVLFLCPTATLTSAIIWDFENPLRNKIYLPINTKVKVSSLSPNLCFLFQHLLIFSLQLCINLCTSRWFVSVIHGWLQRILDSLPVFIDTTFMCFFSTEFVWEGAFVSDCNSKSANRIVSVKETYLESRLWWAGPGPCENLLCCSCLPFSGPVSLGGLLWDGVMNSVGQNWGWRQTSDLVLCILVGHQFWIAWMIIGRVKGRRGLRFDFEWDYIIGQFLLI